MRTSQRRRLKRAKEVEPLSSAGNDSVPEGSTGARFITERSDHSVSQWLSQNGWTVVTSETGYLAKKRVELTEQERVEVGEFLRALEDHDDVHRVWAA